MKAPPEQETSHIKYSKGHKYQLREDAWFKTNFIGFHAELNYITLYEDGWVYVRKGYAWDGPSGPTLDTKSTLRGSVLHDVLYQLIRFEALPRDARIKADAEALKRWLQDKMWKVRAYVWTKLLNKHAATAAHPDHKRKTYTAP